jgi:hypothetical protein
MERLDGTCWDNDKCSSLSNNTIVKATGDSAAGYVYDQAYAGIAQTYIANNKAELTSVISVSRVGYLRMEGNLIVDNGPFNQSFSARLFSITGNNGLAGNLDFFYGTLTSNNSASMFYLDGNSSQQFLNLNNSIIRDQGTIISVAGNINPFLNIGCNFVHETDSLAIATTLTDTFNINPEFIDSDNGDYHLSPNSLAQDMCDENNPQANFKDLNAVTRGFDNLNVANLRGPYDIGAFEYDNDTIFNNGFE